MPDLKVGRFMPIVIHHLTLWFHCRRTKSLIRIDANLRTFYLLWQFLQSRLCLCLLTFMKYKCHFQNQHQKLYHISKAQLSTFSYGHPNILSKGKRSERRGKAPFLLSFCHAWVTKSDQIKSKVDEAWINRQTILTGAINSNSFQLFLKQKERKWWYEKMHFLKSRVDSILEFICSMRTYILG